ncbi:SDR family oxidoreductase [Streptomyces zhihengii]|uniref:SDR family oxidoreductase n=1 Tax=Streptomyces zhihengii TaxID=1818004 RepID=UPI0033A53A3A
MKVVVIGGTGLIGSKTVKLLGEEGHEVVAAAPDTGVNTLTGEGLAEALRDADVTVDVTNAPVFEEGAVAEFFRTSTGNILKAAKEAGVGHHVVLSIIGTEHMQDSWYLRAKQTQEDLVRQSGVPFTIVHAAQFFEFVLGIADMATVDGAVRLAPVRFQPAAASDIASFVARTAAGQPVSGVVEVAGPEPLRLDETVREALAAKGDARSVVSDPAAGYSGAAVEESTLMPGPEAHLTETSYEDWRAARH